MNLVSPPPEPSLTLAFTAGSQWHPGIGDPTVMGWLTVFAYFGAAFLCLRRARNTRTGARPAAEKEAAWFWALVGACLVLLGINKQLDLQTWFTLFVKRLALEQGWYERRHSAQILFILAVGITGALLLAVAYSRLREALPQYGLALLGLIFLGSFILIRASSFHHVDQAIGFRFAGLKMNWILELGGILIIGTAAARRLSHPQMEPPAERSYRPLWPRSSKAISETKRTE